MARPKHHVFVCTHSRPAESGKTCCSGRGAETLFEKLREMVRSQFPQKEVRVTKSGCLGYCKSGCNMVVYPAGTWYSNVKEEDLEEIFQHHLMENREIQRLKRDEHLL
ncbi:MAG: ferredoxin [Deltaproteobacteria bacterium CG_4_10_14_0_2_um_filter_43_8]|nr:MAG: ferredoxin [Deltaproteobacteria bacterium CG11_big_fil_rev_8_21_14_0_20_42_23]PJA21258.1 MAG: ferredoxin [Deltaproteobacteria bacterium CG_4_10_14_0_2_um_filter_43_8]PJC64210.1 MAG: ferredoxin [Deltaproteobacteria bacterium CG_4_9_14_0_2_um_filter_42_21]